MNVMSRSAVRPGTNTIPAQHAIITGALAGALMWCGVAEAQPKPLPDSSRPRNTPPTATQPALIPVPDPGPESAPGSMPPIRPIRPTAVDPALRAASAQLDDASFAVREQATRLLMDQATDVGQIYSLLTGNDLTPEQRYRLLAILRERLLSTPRGALGISTSTPQNFGPPGNGPPGPSEIRVNDLIPGLPAERLLQIGDRITAVDDQALDRFDQLITYVQEKKPGEKVTLTVQRTRVDNRGKTVVDDRNLPISDTIHVEIVLGSADLLKFPQGQMQVSPVERDRAAQATQATQRFSPQPRRVNIQGEDSITINSRTAISRAPDRVDPSVERYWAIQQLLKEQELIRSGLRQETPEVRAQWINRWQFLVGLAQQPDRTAEEREFLQRVIERFTQLIDQSLEPVGPR